MAHERNFNIMNKYKRDIILLVNDENVHPDVIDCTVESLHEVISLVDNMHGFCRAHELVCRNRITTSRRKITRAVKHKKLKAFRFLINKN